MKKGMFKPFMLALGAFSLVVVSCKKDAAKPTDNHDHNDSELITTLELKFSGKGVLGNDTTFVVIFNDTDGCVTPVLSISEAPLNEHNVQRNTYTNLDGVIQPSPSPRFSKSVLGIKHNSKEKGADSSKLIEKFNLDPKAFN